MYQVDLYERSRKTEALAIVSSGDDYHPDFYEYLKSNWHIYLAFENRALQLVKRGFQNYSSKTIVCVLRFESDAREIEPNKNYKSQFKIRDQFTADLSRIFEDMNPQQEGFFRQRVRRAA